jgi:hypothetical protein
MAKKKVVKAQEGLKNVAVAVGSALGKLAAKIGLSETTPPPVSKPAKKKSAPKKKPGATKQTSAKKTLSRIKKPSK